MAIYHPLLFSLDAERAHALTVAMIDGWGAAGAPFGRDPGRFPRLASRVAGIDFTNPVGLAAGVDKDGVAIDGWFGLGFGGVEIGTLTPRPQPGNPRPRLFRLPDDRGVINRMGFNNGGLDAALPRVAKARRMGVLGINVGANKDAVATHRAIEHYRDAVARASSVADYVTINISSPNTPGLRDLQAQPLLGELLGATRAAAGSTPLFLKIAPDLDTAGIDTIARAAIEHRLAAIIVGNTTVSRPPLASPHAGEAGGLSGAPLAPLARRRLADVRSATGGGIALIAAGGIDSGAEAYARIRAGASLVQLYSALIYAGPGLVARMLADLDALLVRDGFVRIGDAVGAG